MGIEPTSEAWEVCFDILSRGNFRIADNRLRVTIKLPPLRVVNFCHAMANPNKSNGYEGVASVFITAVLVILLMVTY
jgi:hypothetical protein